MLISALATAHISTSSLDQTKPSETRVSQQVTSGAAEPAVGHGLEHVELDRLTRDHNPVRQPLF
jgi:hypothetical protein